MRACVRVEVRPSAEHKHTEVMKQALSLHLSSLMTILDHVKPGVCCLRLFYFVDLAGLVCALL